MLISQNFGNEVSVLVGNSETKPVTISKTVVTFYVSQNTVVPTITHLLRTQTKVVTTTNTYPLRSTSVPVVTVGDSYPIKKLYQYLLSPPPVAEVTVTDDSSVNIEYIPQTTQNYINELTANVFVTPSNTQVPVSYYNATGTFWSTG